MNQHEQTSVRKPRLLPVSSPHWLLGALLAVSVMGLGGCQDPASDVKKAAAEKAGPADKAGPTEQAGKQEPAAEGQKPSAEEMREKTENPIDEKLVEKVRNPKKRAPYAGPTGTVRGVVRATGDLPIEVKKALAKMEAKCTDAPSVFGKVFREGEGRTLADVFVAVTEYDGFVPPKNDKVEVRGKGCAWTQRTYGVTFGQSLEIAALDNRPYVPELLGEPKVAQLFVMPRAKPVTIYPKHPGRIKLVDSMRLYNVAEVIVVPFATFDVTALDGKFEITGVPAGEVKVNALLPQTNAVADQTIQVKAGETTELEFELAFDASIFAPKD